MLNKYIGKVWQSLINRDFKSPDIHKKVLFLLMETYMNRIDNAVFLTDFLMGSMNIKGIISILALEGMSKLMQRSNM